MPSTTSRTLRAAFLASALTAGALTAFAAPPAGAVAGAPVADGSYAFTARIAIGDTNRACTGALVDRSWVITAASCFADDPAGPAAVDGAPKWATTVTVGRTDLTATGTGATSGVKKLVARPERDLVMAELATPIDGIAPLRIAATAPATAETLRVPGYGRTGTEWVPSRLHSGAFTVGAVRATATDITGTGGAAICKGDTGAPVIRESAAGAELVAVASRSWQGGCLGETGTRTGAVGTRADDIAGWVQQVRSTAPGWKTQALVRAGNGLFRGARLHDGTWTPFEDVQAGAGDVGGVRAVSTAAIDGDTHVLALGGDGRLHHAVHRLDGSWSTFGDVYAVTGDPGPVTQVAAASRGAELDVVVLADGRPYHSVRHADGNWSPFAPVFSAAGPLSGVTAVAVAGSGPDLQVAVVAGGRVHHTIRSGATAGWSGWGAVDDAAGATGPVVSLALARQGSDMNLAVVTEDGAQHHTVRHADGTWQSFRSLGGVFGQLTATSVSAAPADGEAHFALTTTDNRVLLASRLADAGWTAPQNLDLTGLNGSHTGTAVTASF
ncbi:trypsin-like serine protease [Kitasatospora sp. NPDC056327]|uniref:trypsin-like serine protease n=1 Tax=Kitasatospora sp. NPDC056327 TaxID=3345785 RepID=UPI0035D52F15